VTKGRGGQGRIQGGVLGVNTAFLGFFSGGGSEIPIFSGRHL